METGYDVQPSPVGRSTHRGVRVAVLAAAVFLGIVLLKPWSSPPRVDNQAVSVSPAPVASAAFGVIPVRAGPDALPGWPAGSSPSILADATAIQAEGAIRGLTIHSGQWGVGNAGVGPRMFRDEPWTDWVTATPEAVEGGPLHIATWPGTNICDGLPAIYDNPSLVAVTAPSDLVPDWRLTGWWTDGSRVASLRGSVFQVSAAGNRGISYLERTDRAPWPRGRYEFHVSAGDSTVALTVCITRRG
jgi:hypothetical protein